MRVDQHPVLTIETVPHIQDRQVLRVIWEALVPQAQQVLLAIKEIQDQVVLQVSKVPRGTLDLQVLAVYKVLRVG